MVELDGHPTWVQDSGGDGPVLLLLHGGFIATESNFGAMLPFLEASRHRIVGFDRRGHGRTPDGDGPFSYAAMAGEAAALIEHLGGGPVHAVGHSDGGITLLELALRRPELLTSMAVIGANYHHEGTLPQAVEMMGGIVDDEMMREMYVAASPDGAEHWPVVAAKAMEMMTTQPTLTTDDLGRIPTPTLVMAGDDDLFPLSHTTSLYQSLPSAQLAVLPGASHLCVFEQAELVTSMILRFFDDPAAHRMMPVLRPG